MDPIKRTRNTNINNAKDRKYDEFYTKMDDIVNELGYYKEQFKDKVVYCNCDNPNISNFTKYFTDHFDELGLKRLISTHYISQARSFFCNKSPEKPQYLIKDRHGFECGPLQGDGDFKKSECLELLKQSDIVVTNPPFSLFRNFVSLMLQNNKKFLILGTLNVCTYKEIFSYLRDNIIRLGVSKDIKDFEVPDDYYLDNYKIKNNKKVVSIGLVRWFTNLDHNHYPKAPEFTKEYDPQIYQYYDNYNAIEAPNCKLIPNNFSGVIGAPVTFIDIYNPDYFVLSYTESPFINNKAIYRRIMFRHKKYIDKPLPKRPNNSNSFGFIIN